MYLVQALLPLRDNEGCDFPRETFDHVVQQLTDQFGGATAYTRSPAEGAWAQDDREQREDVIVVEVMVEKLDRSWWAEFRRQLEGNFGQEQILARALRVELL